MPEDRDGTSDDAEDALGGGTGNGDEDLRDRVERLHAELEATAELPVERTASRWIGEAEAVAGDAATADLGPAVRRERIEHVVELLSNVDGTGDERADEHVARARELATAVVEDDSDPAADR